MGWDVSSGPGVTALGLAAARSVESGRADRLIEDPFARALFEAGGEDLPMLLDWPEADTSISDAEALHLHGSRYIGLRTRFYDDTLLAAIRQGAGQAVLLGAGLDTRAFRLALPASFRLFEVDQPGVFDFKDAALAAQGATPRCSRSAIGVDLREEWAEALVSGGFEPDLPTAWLAEGLLPYLPPRAQSGLLSAVHGLTAPGSAITLDRIVGDPAEGDRLRGLSERSGIDMRGLLAPGGGDDLVGALRAQGWEAGEQSTSTLADRYGRDLSDPFPDTAGGTEAAEPPWLDTVFLTARYGSTRPRRIA
jgi:methyltransferase (TIGR00027 family)